jgi:hypothetical protein
MTTAISLPAAVVCYRAEAEAGPALDAFVANWIGTPGGSAEPITPGTAYRLRGSAELLDVVATALAGTAIALAPEAPPADVIRVSTKLRPPRVFNRSFIVHGVAEAPSYVARAVDRGLAVTSEGVGRWSVTGSTADLVAWQAAIYGKTTAEVLEMFGWTPESVAAEDNAAPTVNLPPLTVNVVLPERQTDSEITRNADGDIIRLLQITSTKAPA